MLPREVAVVQLTHSGIRVGAAGNVAYTLFPVFFLPLYSTGTGTGVEEAEAHEACEILSALDSAGAVLHVIPIPAELLALSQNRGVGDCEALLQLVCEVCLLHCLLAFLFACVWGFICLSACLLVCLSACLLVCLYGSLRLGVLRCLSLSLRLLTLRHTPHTIRHTPYAIHYTLSDAAPPLRAAHTPQAPQATDGHSRGEVGAQTEEHS
jgi:hypothetical protein